MKMRKSVSDLRNLLVDVSHRCGNDFSGVGIIITDQISRLPILPLRLRSEPPPINDTAEALATISVISSPFHDGFHILDGSFHLQLVAQYFSPPVTSPIILDYTKNFGGRYVAAQIGSTLPDVMLTGIASYGFGIAVFKHGSVRHFEHNP
jgi:hypothetical protein